MAETKIERCTINICAQCIALEGESCNNPYCVFCRRTMQEVGEYLDALLIRSVIDGVRMEYILASRAAETAGATGKVRYSCGHILYDSDAPQDANWNAEHDCPSCLNLRLVEGLRTVQLEADSLLNIAGSWAARRNTLAWGETVLRIKQLAESLLREAGAETKEKV